MNFQAILSQNTHLSAPPFIIGNSQAQRFQKQTFVPHFKKSTNTQVSLNSANQPFRRHTIQASSHNPKSSQQPPLLRTQNVVSTVPQVSISNTYQPLNLNPASQTALWKPSNLGFMAQSYSYSQNAPQNFQDRAFKSGNSKILNGSSAEKIFLERGGQRGDKQIVRASGAGYGSDVGLKNEQVPDFKIQFVEDYQGLKEVKLDFNEYEWEENNGITHITSEGKSNLMRQFAIECLVYNMPQEFIQKMKDSAKFRENAIDTMIKFYNRSFDHNVNQTFSTAFDLNLNQVYFYSTFKVILEDELDKNTPVLKNRSGLLKSDIINCSNYSVFDDWQSQSVKKEKIMLNQDDQYVRNNIIVNNGESHMNDNSSYAKNIMRNKQKGEEKLFVPKDKVFALIGEVIKQNQFFYMHLIGDRAHDVNENIKLYYTDSIPNNCSDKIWGTGKRGDKQIVRATGPGYGSDRQKEEKLKEDSIQDDETQKDGKDVQEFEVKQIEDFTRNRITSVGKQNLKRQFAIECLVYCMPKAFIVNMRNSLTFRDYAIEKIYEFYDSPSDFQHIFPTAYDLNLNQMYFYSTFKDDSHDSDADKPPVQKNLSGLLKSEILSCNNYSVFDDFQLVSMIERTDASLSLNKVMLNQDDEYVRNNIILDNGESHMNENSSYANNVLSNNQEGEEKLFVPKDKVFQYMRDIIKSDQFFAKHFEIGGDEENDINEKIKIYYTQSSYYPGSFPIHGPKIKIAVMDQSGQQIQESEAIESLKFKDVKTIDGILETKFSSLKKKISSSQSKKDQEPLQTRISKYLIWSLVPDVMNGLETAQEKGNEIKEAILDQIDKNNTSNQALDEQVIFKKALSPNQQVWGGGSGSLVKTQDAMNSFNLEQMEQDSIDDEFYKCQEDLENLAYWNSK